MRRVVEANPTAEICDGPLVKADPEIPINCPYCGAALIYVRTEGGTHYYRCDRHGMLMLPPDGRVRQVPA